MVALMSVLKGAGKQSNECVSIRARSSVEVGSIEKESKDAERKEGLRQVEGRGFGAYRDQRPFTELELSEEVLSLTLSRVLNTLWPAVVQVVQQTVWRPVPVWFTFMDPSNLP